MRPNLGLMQGRLLPEINNRIQAFPVDNWFQEFEKVNSIGIRNLEWTFDHEGLYKNPILDIEMNKYIEILIDQFNINITTATCDNLMQAPIHKTGPSGVTTLENLIKFMELVKNSPIEIIVWPLVDTGNICTKSELARFDKLIKIIIPILEELKLRIAFETDFSPENNKSFLAGLPNEYFGLNLDIGNSACYGNSLSMECELNFDRILNVHIKDRFRKGPTVPLGEGDVNWDEVREVLAPYDKLIILQCARISSLTETETIKTYINFLKAYEII